MKYVKENRSHIHDVCRDASYYHCSHCKRIRRNCIAKEKGWLQGRGDKREAKNIN
jgi:hypothetical protein